MSLNKAIEHNKEHRKQYRGAKSVDSSCRNHGDCLWCKNNRIYRSKRLEESMDCEEKEFINTQETDRYTLVTEE